MTENFQATSHPIPRILGLTFLTFALTGECADAAAQTTLHPVNANTLLTRFQLTTPVEMYVVKTANEVSPEEQAELQMWKSVKASADPVTVMLFIRGFPESVHLVEARALLSQILANEFAEAEAAAIEADMESQPIVEVPSRANDPQAEARMIAIAQSSGQAAHYQAYLKTFPNGIYAELALQELANIHKQ